MKDTFDPPPARPLPLLLTPDQRCMAAPAATVSPARTAAPGAGAEPPPRPAAAFRAMPGGGDMMFVSGRRQTARPAAGGDAGGDARSDARSEARSEARSDMGGEMGPTIQGRANEPIRRQDPPAGGDGSGGGGGRGGNRFHRRQGPQDFAYSMQAGIAAVRRNLAAVMVLTCVTNLLVLAIPVYLFQISDRVLTSRSVDTLIMLSLVMIGAVVLQAVLDGIRRMMLMRTAVELAARLGAPILSAAAHASLHGTGREYQTLGDLQQLRGFMTSGTLMSFLDIPFVPVLLVAVYLVHPDLGMIVTVTAVMLLVVAVLNQKATERQFGEANIAQSRANSHVDSMSRNSQIINAMAMIPEAVAIWGRDTATSLTAQVKAQDRNIMFAALSRAIRLLTQIALLGWGAYLAISGEMTGGMVIAASVIAGRALAPIEGSIEGWHAWLISRGSYLRIRQLLTASRLQFEKLWLPRPEGRLDVERLLYVPGGTKQVVLNGLSFSLTPGETLAVIGNSGAGKSTLGKMLVGSILPTSGNVRLDLMDLRNWDPRQFGESIGYLPQDVQLFPGSIKDNIGRMRADATDEQIHTAAVLADVHDMIASLPHGYETLVAADGAPLSGGQKQRIALARAFYGNPRLVVLDEPNSNLDTTGDRALAKAIQHARANGITVVVITQKPALLQEVDKIMLLNDGTVALFGQRAEVLQKLQAFSAQGRAKLQGQ